MFLNDKNVLFLGSSVTYGSAAGGVSFVEFASEVLGYRYIKEAVSGTTLVDINEKSYISRLKTVDRGAKIDLFVCQLSTNDAKKDFALCDIEKSIRFILEYVKTNFNCPAVFYTGTFFESQRYKEMVQLLYELKKEYDFHLLDLYNDAKMLAVCEQDYKKYMHDAIHPTLLGYKEWWTPEFVKFLQQLP